MSLRLVLDTNVWLDWLVFGDAIVAPLKIAAESAQIEILIDAACTQELIRVLAYPLRKNILTADEQAARMAECRRVAQAIEPAAMPADTPPLPKCRDADDQKFLELALACRADYLVTKDLMLLELARRKIRRTPFRIVTPAQLNAAMTALRV